MQALSMEQLIPQSTTWRPETVTMIQWAALRLYPALGMTSSSITVKDRGDAMLVAFPGRDTR